CAFFKVEAQVREVEVKCADPVLCADLDQKAKNLFVGKENRGDIERGLEFLLLDQSIDRLKYEIYADQIKQSDWKLVIQVVPKIKIRSIKTIGLEKVVDGQMVPTLLPFKEGNY